MGSLGTLEPSGLGFRELAGPRLSGGSRLSMGLG